MKKSIISMSMIVASLITVPAFAHVSDVTNKIDDTKHEVESSVEQTTTKVEDTVKVVTDDSAKKGTDARTKILEQSEVKTENKMNSSERSKEVRQKLEGRRLARCENREVKINQLLQKGATIGDQQLANLMKHEGMIKDFYAAQNLNSDGYAAAVALADQKEADAEKVLQEIRSENFACNEADSTKPADSIRSMVKRRHDALSAYRDSLHQLINVVRTAQNEKEQ